MRPRLGDASVSRALGDFAERDAQHDGDEQCCRTNPTPVLDDERGAPSAANLHRVTVEAYGRAAVAQVVFVHTFPRKMRP